MEEQPVALATTMRSPKSWVANLIYGVSPHPAQAPENSNNGCNAWEERTVDLLTLARSSSGIAKKNSQFFFSCSFNGAWGFMFKALNFVSVLFFTGQTSTQMPQPVQSSGAAWIV